jgi:hypothetical protein
MTSRSGRQITVVMHEVRERVFTLDLDAMCEDYLWPAYVDDGEITEVLEHSDTWRDLRDDELPKWLTKKQADGGWREVAEISGREEFRG